MPEEKTVKLSIGYERRFGELLIRAGGQNGSGESAWRVPISTLLRNIGVMPEELRQMALDAAKPAWPDEDIEALCTRALPARLDGLSVLDIGGYDGRFAKTCLDRGARAALCLDNHQYRRYAWEQPEPLPGVLYREGDFMEWHEQADIVLFYNVIYHCKEPLAALEKLRALTRKQAIVCSLVRFDDKPRWYLYEPRECNPEDDTVYWGPSPSALKRALKQAGFQQIEEVGQAVERLVLRCR